MFFLKCVPELTNQILNINHVYCDGSSTSLFTMCDDPNISGGSIFLTLCPTIFFFGGGGGWGWGMLTSLLPNPKCWDQVNMAYVNAIKSNHGGQKALHTDSNANTTDHIYAVMASHIKAVYVEDFFTSTLVSKMNVEWLQAWHHLIVSFIPPNRDSWDINPSSCICDPSNQRVGMHLKFPTIFGTCLPRP